MACAVNKLVVRVRICLGAGARTLPQPISSHLTKLTGEPVLVP